MAGKKGSGGESSSSGSGEHFMLGGVYRYNKLVREEYYDKRQHIYKDAPWCSWLIFDFLILVCLLVLCLGVYSCAFEMFNKYIPENSNINNLREMLRFFDSEEFLSFAVLATFTLIMFSFMTE